MAEKQVLLAESDVTVHTLFSPGAEPEVDQFGRELFAVSSRVMRAGDTVDADMVPPYVLASAKAGKAGGLKLMSKSEAEKVLADAERLRALAAAPEHMYADGWDNSHSDYLVADSVRVANLANEGAQGDGDDHLSGVVPPAAESAEAGEVSERSAEAAAVAADPSAEAADVAALAAGDADESKSE